MKAAWRRNQRPTWLSGKAAKGQTPRDAVAGKLRLGCYTLLWIVATSWLLSALPLQVGSADWYLRLMASLTGSSPLAVASLSLGAIAIYLVPQGSASARLTVVLRRLATTGFWVFVLLVPLQLFAAGVLVQQTRSADRTRLDQLQGNATALIQEARAQPSKQALVDYLKGRGINVDRTLLESNTLPAVLGNLEKSLASSNQRVADSLATRRRQVYLKTGLDLTKLLTTTLVMLAFLRVYANWSMKQSS